MAGESPGLLQQGLERFEVKNPFPGQEPMEKKVYFVGLLFDSENGIGKLDLPPMPTFEDIQRWKTGEAIPASSFLGTLGELAIPLG